MRCLLLAAIASAASVHSLQTSESPSWIVHSLSRQIDLTGSQTKCASVLQLEPAASASSESSNVLQVAVPLDVHANLSLLEAVLKPNTKLPVAFAFKDLARCVSQFSKYLTSHADLCHIQTSSSVQCHLASRQASSRTQPESKRHRALLASVETFSARASAR